MKENIKETNPVSAEEYIEKSTYNIATESGEKYYIIEPDDALKALQMARAEQNEEIRILKNEIEALKLAFEVRGQRLNEIQALLLKPYPSFKEAQEILKGE